MNISSSDVDIFAPLFDPTTTAAMATNIQQPPPRSAIRFAETVEQEPIWIADLLFARTNRTIKYVEDGNLLILVETTQWEDLLPRLRENAVTLSLFLAAIAINFLLLFMSLSKMKQLYHKKLHCLIANLSLCNIVLSTGFLIYTYLVDIHYDVDSFNTLIRLNDGLDYAPLWPFAKQMIHNEMVENFAIAQALILLALAMDRYAGLFSGYSQFVRHPLCFCAVSVVPYFFALLLFDYQILSTATQMSPDAANVVRLVAFIAPILLAIVLSTCALLRNIQKNKAMGGRLDEIASSYCLLAILAVELVQKVGLLLEILKRNFRFVIRAGGDAERIFNEALEGYYWISHWLFLLSPLYTAVLLLLVVRSYRRRLFKGVVHCHRSVFICLCFCCYKKEPKLDYSCETMRSIIAEQSRLRQMRRYEER